VTCVCLGDAEGATFWLAPARREETARTWHTQQAQAQTSRLRTTVHFRRRPIDRILHMAESLHVGETFQFHKGPISIALSAAAQFSSLEELKKWIS
jgi:hypothetical protein